MIEIAKCVAQLRMASGRNDKEILLAKFSDVPGFKDVMKFIYNPYIRTGIAKAKLSKARPVAINHNLYYTDVIEHFKKHQTGSDADCAFAKCFVDQYQDGSEAQNLAIAMVTKNLKIGVSEKTLNKVYGDNFIPSFGIMRGERLIDVRDKVKGPYIVTEKLDGIRRILVKEDGNVTFYSRSGISDPDLIEIEPETKFLPDNCVFDGELLAIGDFEDSIALRQATNSIANSKGPKRGLTFNIFDTVALDEFKAGKSRHDAKTRKALVAALFGDFDSLKHIASEADIDNLRHFKLEHDFTHIKSVGILGVAQSNEELVEYAAPIWARGFEGVMGNTLKGRYELKKSRDLIKVKNIDEITLTVVDVEEGKNKNQGRCGALVVEYKGNRVGVSGRITDAQRHQWWNDPSSIIGKDIEIDYFGESKNKNGTVSLNCPIFKRVVGTVE